jgi:diguanylate cyclase
MSSLALGTHEPKSLSSLPEASPGDNIDELTGLPNLKLFNERVDGLIDKFPGEFSVLYVDLDDLKAANDGPGGHAAGNELLINASNIINENIRSRDEDRELDVLFKGRTYRIGGDEFVVLLAGAKTEEEVAVVQSRLQAKLKEEGMSASMGGRPHKPGESRSELLDASDRLMYKNKLERKDARYKEQLNSVPRRKRVAHHLGHRLLDYSGIKKPVAR